MPLFLGFLRAARREKNVALATAYVMLRAASQCFICALFLLTR
jgi:hypothetical protein